jgi:hypothetical protein
MYSLLVFRCSFFDRGSEGRLPEFINIVVDARADEPAA